MKSTFQQLLAEGKTEQLVRELLTYTESDKDVHGQVTLLSARFATLTKQKNAGTLSHSEISLEQNKIHDALLSLIGKLPETKDTPGEGKKPNVPSKGNIIQVADKIYNIDHIDNANFT